MADIQLKYEVRTPHEFGIDRSAYYQAALDQIAWADEQGCFDRVSFAEHHGTDDGYLPSPLVLASAAAARTHKLRLQATVVMPFYNPLRLAEDAAVVDVISNGRLELVGVAGYVVPEFEMFNESLSQRGRRIEAAVDVLRKAWTGEPFDYEGRTVRISPRPVQQPGPLIYLGGSAPVAARRAARIADGFLPMIPEAIPMYEQACHELSRQPRVTGKIEAVFVHVSNHPDEDWQRIAPHALSQSNMYSRWQAQTGVEGIFEAVTDAQVLRDSGTFAVVTPEQCLEMIERLGDQGTLSLDPLMGGMPEALGWESLKLFAQEVAPHL